MPASPSTQQPKPQILAFEGRVLLASGPEHDCIVRCLSADVFEIVGGGVAVESGERTLCRTGELGTVGGAVGDRTESGFLMAVAGGGSRRARLASRIAWHRDFALGRVDLRGDARIVPLAAAVRVSTPEGRTVEAEFVDVSSTGAALRMLPRPPVGTRLTVGRRRAEVVRDIDGGVAVRFVLPLRREDVTPDITL